MNNMVQMVALAAALSLPVAAHAGINDHGCQGCHKLDKKVFGPSFKEIAAKYKGDAEAPAKLLNSVKKGSTDKWGNNRAMPAQEVPDAELKEIIGWILSQ